jgi:uridine phosphorylase
MSYPRVAGKHGRPAMVSPAEHAEYVRVTFNDGEPASVRKAMLLYQGTVLNRALARLPGQEKEGWISGDLWMADPGSGPVAVCGRFGKGAPAAGLVVEQLTALGARKVISVGTAGALAPHLKPGDVVICDRAIRDEGLSYHYLPGSKYCGPSPALTGLLCAELRADHQHFCTGTTWSTDAPYRETAHEVSLYRREQVLTVDMEAAGIFAVGQFRGIEVSAAFSITDVLRDDGRQRHAPGSRCNAAIDHLVDAAIRAL